ncbi:helix-turn-helix domain-containing protein [Mycoplasmatota bacterium WC30]
MAKKGQTFSKYTNDIKKKVISEKISKGKSYRHLSEKYNIAEGTIFTWIYQYRKNKNQVVNKKKGRPKKDENIDYKEKYEILKKFQDYLEEVDREKK